MGKNRVNVALALIKGLLLAVALVLIQVYPAAAATARATTMKLGKTTGTVTVKTVCPFSFSQPLSIRP